jgi:transcription antitermination protein NusB
MERERVMTGERRKARAAVLQALYELDTTGHGTEPVLARCLAEKKLAAENQEFVRDSVNGVVRHREQLDGHIRKFAPSWPIEQLAVIDRNILRLAIFEILFDNKVTVKVAINEAVELAKRFGGESSAKFVNGVLGSVSALARG